MESKRWFDLHEGVGEACLESESVEAGTEADECGRKETEKKESSK